MAVTPKPSIIAPAPAGTLIPVKCQFHSNVVARGIAYNALDVAKDKCAMAETDKGIMVTYAPREPGALATIFLVPWANLAAVIYGSATGA